VNGPKAGADVKPSLDFWEDQDSLPSGTHLTNRKMKKKGGKSSSDDLSHMLETVHDDLSKMLEESVTEDEMSMSMDFGESSECESLPQNQAVLELLSKNAATTNLKDPTTSRGKAFQWLTTFKRTLNPCQAPSQTLQLYSLLVFYYATGGSNWTKNDGWLKDENYCSWHGITCDLEDKVFELTLGKCLKGKNTLHSLRQKLFSQHEMPPQTRIIYKEHFPRKLVYWILWNRLVSIRTHYLERCRRE
jgi:hypothetical protein